MDRRNFFYKQTVSASDLDEAFDFCEAADHNVVADLGMSGIQSGFGVVEKAPTSMHVFVDSGIAYDKSGKRVAEPAGATVDCSVDENGVSTDVATAGKERWISIFARYSEREEIPAIDGNSQQVYTKIFEDCEVFVRMSTELAIGSNNKVALMSDAVLLADVRLVHGQTAIVNAGIDLSRRETWLRLSGTGLGDQEFGSPKEAMDFLFGVLDGISGGGGVAHSFNRNWYGGVSVGTRSGTQTNEVKNALNAIVADLAINGASGGGAELVGTRSYSTAHASWANASVQAALQNLATAISGHVAGGVPRHNGDAIDVAQVSAGSREAPISAGHLNATLQALGGRLDDRVATKHMSERIAAVVVEPDVKNATHQDAHFGLPYFKGARVGRAGVNQSQQEVMKQIWNTNSAILHPYSLGNSIYASGADIVGICSFFLNRPTSGQDSFTVPYMAAISGNPGAPALTIWDPGTLDTTVFSSATVLAEMPSGTGEVWQAIDMCSSRIDEVMILFANVGLAQPKYYVAVFNITGINQEDLYKYMELAELPGQGSISEGVHSRIIGGSKTHNVVVNNWDQTENRFFLINEWNGMDGIGGNGDLPGNYVWVNGIISTGRELLFVGYQLDMGDTSASNYFLRSANLDNLSEGSPRINVSSNLGNHFTNVQLGQLAYDGQFVYLPNTMPTYHAMMVIDTADGTFEEFSTHGIVFDSGLTPARTTFGRLCFDGRYIWQIARDENAHLFAFAIDPTAMRIKSGSTLLETGAVKKKIYLTSYDSALRNWPANTGLRSYGKMHFDGADLWIVLSENDDGGLGGRIVVIRNSAQ